MASLTEKLQFVVKLDAQGAIQGFSKLGDAADKSLKKADSNLDKVGKNLTKFGSTAVAAAGIAAVGLYKAGKSASDLGESVNAVNVTFGTAAKGVLKLGENAAESVGLSNAAFNGLAVQFSSFATTIAGTGGDVVATLDDMTTRAADFASVMNIDVAEAARIFQSGLAGETEPIKKFGIDLSAAAVEAYAYANGIAKAGETLTETEKVQARYGLLMEKTAKTQGDFANTADSAANAQRVAAAEMENAMASLGASVTPIMAEVASAVGGVAKAFSTANEATDGFIGKAVGIGVVAIGAAGAISTVVGQAIKMRDNFSKVTSVLGGFNVSAKSAGLALGGIGLVVAGAVAAYSSLSEEKEAGKRVTLEYVDALKQEAEGQRGAVTALIARDITNADFLDTMHKLGLSEKDIADVVDGKTVPAFEKALEVIRALRPGMGGGTEANKDFAESLGISESEADNFYATIGGLKNRIADAKSQFALATEVTKNLGVSMDGTTGAVDDQAGALSTLKPLWGDLSGLVDLAKGRIEETAAALEAETDAIDDQSDAIDDHITALENDLKAQTALVDYARGAADAQVAANKSNDDYARYLEELPGKLAEINKSDESRAEKTRQINQLYADGAGLASGLADDIVDMWDKQTDGAMSATEKGDLFRKGMIDTASMASGPARQAILDYAFAANEIPDEKKTAIIAALDAGELETATTLLNEASGPRTSEVKADADEASLKTEKDKLEVLAQKRDAKVLAIAETKKAMSDLDAVTKPRFVDVIPRVRSSSGNMIGALPDFKLPGHAAGTRNAEDAFIAHDGELVTGRQGASVFTKAETNRMIGTGSLGGLLGSGQAGTWEVTGSGVPGGGGAAEVDEIELARRQYQRGKISLDQFKAILLAKKAGLEEYSDEEQALYDELEALDAQASQAAEVAAQEELERQDRIVQWQFEHGQISLADYLAHLGARKSATEAWSSEYIALMQKMEDAQKAADDAASAARDAFVQAAADQAKAAQDAIDAVFDQANAQAALQQAINDVNEAMADQAEAEKDAYLYGLDPKRSAEEKAGAVDKANQAKQKTIDALIKGVDARANAAGLKDDTPEWANFIRSEIEQFLQNNPQYSAGLNAYLANLPKFHSGGVVPGITGQEVPIMAQAGETVLRPGAAGGDVHIHNHGDFYGSPPDSWTRVIMTQMRTKRRAAS